MELVSRELFRHPILLADSSLASFTQGVTEHQSVYNLFAGPKRARVPILFKAVRLLHFTPLVVNPADRELD